MTITTTYLNPKNPEVQRHYTGWQKRKGIPPWEPLPDEQLRAMELDFLARLPMFQREREYLYPFFLDIANTEVKAAYAQFNVDHKIGYGFTFTDAQRDEFERQFAAGKVSEADGAITVSAPALAAVS